MKWFVLALCFTFATLSVEGIRRCQSADDCQEEECCVSYTIIPYLGGVCRGLRDEGTSCTPVVRKSKEDNPDIHIYQCPCKPGLECVASREVTVFGHVIKHKPVCVVSGKEDFSTAFPEPETEQPEPDTSEPEPEPESDE